MATIERLEQLASDYRNNEFEIDGVRQSFVKSTSEDCIFIFTTQLHNKQVSVNVPRFMAIEFLKSLQTYFNKELEALQEKVDKMGL